MNNQEFTISLRVRHPVYADRVIVESLGLTPKVAHAVGAQRKTPTGQALDGSYTETFCVFTLIVRQQGRFEDGVGELLPSLSAHREFLRSIVDSGGSSELYVGAFVDGGESAGFTLGIETMTALADLGVRLTAEYYWDSDVEVADVPPRLVTITGAVSGATTTFTYDAVGRVESVEGSAGYLVEFAYDNLNAAAEPH